MMGSPDVVNEIKMTGNSNSDNQTKEGHMVYYALLLSEPTEDTVLLLQLNPKTRLPYQVVVNPTPFPVVFAMSLVNHYAGTCNLGSIGFNNRVFYERVQVPSKIFPESDCYKECSAIEIDSGHAIYRVGQLTGDWCFLVFIDDDEHRHWFQMSFHCSDSNRFMPLKDLVSFQPIYIEDLEF